MTEHNPPITDRRMWVRVLYMLFFWLAFSIAEFLIAVVALFQAVCALVTGSTNDGLHRFGKNLSTYVHQIMEYVTFNSDDLPFPFNDWPDGEPTPSAWTEPRDDIAPAPAAPEPAAPAQTPNAGESAVEDVVAPQVDETEQQQDSGESSSDESKRDSDGPKPVS